MYLKNINENWNNAQVGCNDLTDYKTEDWMKLLVQPVSHIIYQI